MAPPFPMGKLSAGCDEMDILAPAMRAGDSVRPDNRNQELKASIGIRKMPDGFNQGLRKLLCVFHDSEILPQNRGCVNYIITKIWY